MYIQPYSCKHTCCKVVNSTSAHTLVKDDNDATNNNITDHHIADCGVIYQAEEGCWNDSPIELFSDTTTAATTQHYPMDEQIGNTVMLDHLPVVTARSQQQEQQDRQLVLSTAPLPIIVQKPQSSSLKNKHTTRFNNYHTITNAPTSAAGAPPSSSDDDFLWDDDDEWTQLAVQATEQAEKNYKNASSSTRVLPTRIDDHDIPFTYNEEEDEEEESEDYYGDKMWHDIGEYCYNAFEKHFKKLERSRPLLPPSSLLPVVTQPSPEPGIHDDDSLRHWLDTRVVVVPDNSKNSNNYSNNEQNV